MNAITVLQFWRFVLLPDDAVVVVVFFLLVVTRFSGSLEIFHHTFPDTFLQISPHACLLQSSN